MKSRMLWLGVWLAVLTIVVSVSVTLAAPSSQGDAQRGKYLSNTAGCWACHGQNLAGYKDGGALEQPESAPFGQSFNGPFGVIPTKNLTSDKETGLGGWTDAEIEQALRAGKSKDGRQLHPIMPYANYAGMADQDMKDLIAYLRSVPAVKNAVPPTKLNGPVPPAPPGRGFPNTAPTSGPVRGEYLVMNVAGCGDCHTPSTPQGAPDRAKMLAGNVIPTAKGVQIAPNLTPDEKTGIGKWTEAQIALTLKTGERPGRSPVGGLMAEVIGIGHPAFQGFGFSQMTELDRLAIAQYLKTLQPVENVPVAPPPAQPPAQAQPTAAPTTAAQPTAAAQPTTAAQPTAAAPAATATTVPTTAAPASTPAASGTATMPTTGASAPQTMPATGALPIPLAESLAGLGAVLGFAVIGWRRAKMK